jgi:hypothetical protein
MSGGLTQLVAIGAQDVHLVGNPEVSFFQSSYRRHTNFSQVVDRQLMQGTPGNNAMTTVRFDRKGDLLSHVYLTASNGSGAQHPDWSNVIDHIELYIGGQLIDSQSYDFCMSATDVMATTYSKSYLGSTLATDKYFYPLRFFFCENWQSALPLVALQYHDVEIRIYWGNDLHSYSYDLMANYVYLDTVEREAVSKTSVEMLITQVQKMVPSGTSFTQDLTFNHPVKYLVSSDHHADGLNSAANKVKLQLNGVDVSLEKYAHPNFTFVPLYYNAPNASDFTKDHPVFIYPFCLDTSKLQPTGTLNFSRIDSARIVSDGLIQNTVYAVNYNILRIEKGMGGLRYSN